MLRAIPHVREELKNVKLMVVGSFANDKQDYMQLIHEAHIEDCVEIIDEYTPDNEVEKYFAACDVVVLPYESATQSGIVQIAYGFEKPVIVTSVGGLPDVVTDGKTGYVVEAGVSEVLTEAILKILEEGKAEELSCNVKQEAYRFDWRRMREVIEKLVGTE